MATRVVDLGSVVGPQGPKGDNGAAGADGAQGPRGRGAARFVVGTSAAGWTASDCDYLCDGTADDVEINAAIAALPTSGPGSAGGGEVVILDGTYHLTANISVNKNNVTLRGSGGATMLVGGDIQVSGNFCTVSDLRLYNGNVTVTGNFNLITHVIGGDNEESNKYCFDISGTGNKVIGCDSRDNDSALRAGGSCTVVTGNTLGDYTLVTGTSCVVTGNHCNGNLIVTGTRCLVENNISDEWDG